jgi:hypothetical protein
MPFKTSCGVNALLTIVRKSGDEGKFLLNLYCILMDKMITVERREGRMRGPMRRFAGRGLAMVCAAVLLPMAAFGTGAASCAKVELTGEVNQGQEWKAEFGEGWVVRLVPIAGSTGWDVVVDRAAGAGFPDALLVATPPYESINEREVGTTYGLRAQDAIGWNPRSFRFLTNADALVKGQKLYAELHGNDVTRAGASQGLMALMRQSSAGQLRILNARIVPGMADAAPYAERWAMQSSKTPHTVADRMGQGSGRGEIEWMRFSITLWLPAGWKTPKGSGGRSGCAQ